jgi:hypothetical protein
VSQARLIAFLPGRTPVGDRGARRRVDRDNFQVGLDKELNFIVTGSPSFFSDQLRTRLDRFNRLPPGKRASRFPPA